MVLPSEVTINQTACETGASVAAVGKIDDAMRYQIGCVWTPKDDFGVVIEVLRTEHIHIGIDWVGLALLYGTCILREYARLNPCRSSPAW